MPKQISDLANGLGYVYVTDVSSSILEAYENNAESARLIKLKGVESSAVGGNRVATAIVTIDAPTNNGSITAITIGGINAINTASPITYTGATTAVALATLIETAINGYSTGTTSQDFTCQRVDAQIYILSNAASGTTYNGQTPVLTNTGNFTYTVDQDMIGGSSTSTAYDGAYGYRFYLDADYGSTECSGGGTALVDSTANAIEITDYIVNKGLQGNIPVKTATIASNAVIGTRSASISYLSLTGEGAADDDLDTILLEGTNTGDILVLYSATNAITLLATGNINLITTKGTSYEVQGVNIMSLIFLGGEWFEFIRNGNFITTTANYRTNGYGIFALEDYNSAAVGTGGTVTYVANTDEKGQKLTGSSTLLGNQAYALDNTAEDGDEFFLEYDASVTLGAFTLTIFGISVSADQALNGGLIFYARFLGGVWYSHVYPNLNEGNTYPYTAATSFYANSSVTAAKVSTNLKTEVLSRQISFETSEVGDMKMYMGYSGTVEYLHFTVDKAIAATDDGTIVPKNNGGVAMTDGTITVTASSAIATGFTATPTANNTFVAGDLLTFTTAKTTKGGTGTLYIKVTKA
jgi:hypothetical protein